MSPDSNWDDPFLEEDPAARERARRRAEREARRAKRRGDVAKKVQEAQSEVSPEPAAPAERQPPPQGTERPAVGAIATSEGRSTDDGAPPTEAHPETATKAAPAEPATPAPPSGPARAVVHRRRMAALLGLAGLAFVGLVIVVGINRLGGDDPAPADVFKEQKTIDVTIPEGYRRAQIAEVAKKAGIKGDYEAASKSVKGFDPGRYGADDPQSLEGFLFPATYEEFKGKTKAEDLVHDQLDAFKENMKGVNFGYAKSKNLTQYDVLTIASMVQAEAANTDEMAKIAQVIYNRLAAGDRLGIDATTRYAVDNWTKPLSPEELASTSAYNTRVNTGLPPGPIGNPGLAAIEAAAKPAQGDLYFFVVKPGACGHSFFDNEADFNAAVDEYNTAREAAGGKSPDAC